MTSTWTFEHTAVTTAPPAAVWALWSDVATWPTWNADLAVVTVDGPFATGSTVTMHAVAGGDPVVLRLADVVPGEQFVDEAELAGLTIRTRHRVDPQPDGGHAVTYRMEVDGPAEPAAQVGAAITADFPETVAALVALAERA